MGANCGNILSPHTKFSIATLLHRYLLESGMERHFATGPLRFVEDIRTMREKWKEAGVMEFVQEPGQIVFIPSGWYHQVQNLVGLHLQCSFIQKSI